MRAWYDGENHGVEPHADNGMGHCGEEVLRDGVAEELDGGRFRPAPVGQGGRQVRGQRAGKEDRARHEVEHPDFSYAGVAESDEEGAEVEGRLRELVRDVAGGLREVVFGVADINHEGAREFGDDRVP